jgi:hypothetical protein
MLDSKTIAQGTAEQPSAGSRSNQGEWGNVEGDDASASSLTNCDRQCSVLHRRIERLLDRSRQPVDLIYEKHRSRLKGAENRGYVGLLLKRWPSGRHERDSQFTGNYLSKGRLSEPGRSSEEDMVKSIGALVRSLDRNLKLLSNRALSDEVRKSAWTQGQVNVVLGQNVRSLDPLVLAHFLLSLSALWISSSGELP